MPGVAAARGYVLCAPCNPGGSDVRKMRCTCAPQRRIITPAAKLTQRADGKSARGAFRTMRTGDLVLPAQSEYPKALTKFHPLPTGGNMRSAKIFCWCFLFVFFGGLGRALAGDIQVHEATQTTSQGPVVVKSFLAAGQGPHPAIIVLHGSQGLGKFRAFYERNAAQFAHAGFDAYVVDYYNEQDVACSKTVETRRANFSKRIGVWSQMVSDVVTDVLAQGHKGRAVGIVGFSQGGYLGTSVASKDTRIAALVVYYGGIPAQRRADGKHPITHMPPLLELHGDADTVVPMERGKELVELTRSLGQAAEMVIYPGAGHGFNRTAATDAEQRTLEFFQARLTVAK